mmetsp:Transcript_20914/g.80462  ORF Transcript_20914/g.80462 Transcript_20914/m.80462 type:complete len:552 (-) Transcript_20914:203-1858(-)
MSNHLPAELHGQDCQGHRKHRQQSAGARRESDEVDALAGAISIGDQARHNAQDRQLDTGTQVVAIVEDRPQLAGGEGREEAHHQGTCHRASQQQQAIGCDRLGVGPRRIDHPEIRHARGDIELAGDRGLFATLNEILVVLLLNRIVAVELRRLGLHLRRRLECRHRLGVATRILVHPRLQRRNLHLGGGQNPHELLGRQAARRRGQRETRCRRGGPAQLREFALALLFEVLDELARGDDVGVLVGVALQERVEVAAVLGEAGIELGRAHLGIGFLHQALLGRLSAATRLFSLELRLRSISRVQRLAVFQARAFQLAAQLGDMSGRILAIARHVGEVLQSEFLQPRLGFFQLGLVCLDLLVQKRRRGRGVLSRASQAGLDEDRHQRLNHAFGGFRIVVSITQDVEVVSPAALDRKLAGHRLDRGLLLRLGLALQIQVSHAHQFLDVGTTDQGATQHRDLLLDIGLHREAGHQRLQNRLGIDIDPSAGLIAVGQHEDNHRTDDAGHPSHGQADPAVLPHPPDDDQQLTQERFHLEQSQLNQNGAGELRPSPAH